MLSPMKKNVGEIIIEPGANVWPHEMKTAEALGSAGYTVRFIRRSEEQRAKSADAIINGTIWEFKAPESDKLKVVEKNLRKALHQSDCVVFDSRRMKRLPDNAIRHEVEKWAAELKSLRQLIYVDKHHDVHILK